MGYSGDRYTRPGRILSGNMAALRTGGDGDIERRAADLHAVSRRRADLFNQAVMADSAMDIMLTALIAHEQGTALTRLTAAMANRLTTARADLIIDELIAARLMTRAEQGAQIGLTQLGVEKMREYVAGCPAA